jgi:plastocyanin
VVTLRNLSFTPKRATVRVGQTVEWVNRDNAIHNITSTDGSTIASPNFGGGGRFSFRPQKAGTIRYYCTIHASAMEGVLVVKG